MNFITSLLTFGWLGNVLIITGTWRIAHKHRDAFLITIVGGVCWLYEAYCIGRFDLAFIEAVMIWLTARNYWHWSKDARTDMDVSATASPDQPVPHGRVCAGCDCQCDCCVQGRAKTDVDLG